jgi:peptidoglycan/LPS O-acetylase OafA/YrhL
MATNASVYAPTVIPSAVAAEQPPLRFRGHILEFDGLRAFGSVLVILAHFWVKASVPHIAHLFSLASVAMDSFFVLSGFLITGILLDTKVKENYYRSYYVKRALRIFPLYYLVLVLAAAVTVLASGKAYLGSFGWYAFYLGNIQTAILGAWPKAMALTPLWSLQIEEQFYLLFPFLVKRFSIESLKRLLWGMVLVSPLVRIALYFHDPGNEFLQYVLLPCRMDGLAWGGLIAIRCRQGSWQVDRSWLGGITALVLSAVCAYAVTYGWTGGLARTVGYSFSAFGCAALILLLIQNRDSAITAPLRWNPVAYIGKISYGIYVFQMPVLIAFQRFVVKLHVGIRPGTFAGITVPILLTVAVAALSWSFFEEPILALKSRFS